MEYAVVGAGYAGLRVARALTDMGFDAILYDAGVVGGELRIFEKLEEFKDQYGEFISEINELSEDLDVRKGCVLSTVPFKVLSARGVETCDAKAVICTGATDLTPAASRVYGKRVAGIYTLETALRLLAFGFRIGSRVLVLARTGGEVVDTASSQFVSMDYDVEVVNSTEPAEVFGRKRVERVEVDGEEFRADTLVVYGGRKPFNPRNLNGLMAGNIVECTYDYSAVRKNVDEIIRNHLKE
ncbi:NAD(P)/FAD-dependent oxidoreductase [Archaeoglobus neptunius]|uniref:hypothetical protein n=1 Tax=Archaeoglobus neptunius TaxID=2798580 RepID=UPI0019253159|nr:hypothetical protein [Archaeoglobus neptunius]